MTSTGRRRAEYAIAMAVIVADALVVFAPPLAKQEIFTFRDHADYFTPMRLFTALHLRAGRLPLWNPYNGSGEQWLANPQTGIFYPPTWLMAFIPFSTSYVLYLFLHSLILGTGAWALFRRSAGMPAALVGSVALMFSGPVLSLLDVQNNFTTFAWLPWIIWSALRDRERICGNGAPAAPESSGTGQSTGATRGGASFLPRLSAVFLALAFLAGEPFFAAVAAMVYAVVVRKARTIAVAAAGSAALCAVQLLPFLDMLVGSDRFGGFVGADILRDSMRAGDWLRCIAPPRLVPAGMRAEQFVLVPYMGVVVVLLAIAGIVVLIRAGEYRRVTSWGLLAAVAALMATGPHWIASLPLTVFRYPSRCMPFVALAAVAFAVAGWDRLRRGSAIVDAVLIIAIVADLVIAARPLLATAPLERARLAYPAFIGRNTKILQIYGNEPLLSGGRAAWLSGYLNLYDRRFEASTPAPLAPRAYTRVWTAAQSNLQLLRLMGIGYVLASSEMPPPFELVTRVGGVLTYRVPSPFPLAYLRTASGKIDVPQALSLDASRARVRIASATGGLLVLTQNDVRGWRVSVDGRPAEKKLDLGTFRSVDVPPGTHEITWVYRPVSLPAGAFLTLVALFWLAFGVRVERASRHART